MLAASVIALYVFFTSWAALAWSTRKSHARGYAEGIESGNELVGVLRSCCHDWQAAYDKLKAQLPKRGAKGRFERW